MDYYHRNENDIVAELSGNNSWVFGADMHATQSLFMGKSSGANLIREETIYSAIYIDRESPTYDSFACIVIDSARIYIPKWGRKYRTPFANGKNFRLLLKLNLDMYGFTREREIAFDKMCDLAHTTIDNWLCRKEQDEHVPQ